MSNWLTNRSSLGTTIVFSEHGEVCTDTCTCQHCNRAFDVAPYKRPEDIGGLCPGCWKPICQRCLSDARFNCVPFEEKLNRYEKAMREG